MNLPENDSSGKYVATGTGSTEPKPYGMDGGIGVYASYDTTGTALGEAIIYPTMRRGGRTVYALDVTLKADPKYLWKITGGSSGTSGYTKLAQTWSLPKPLVRSSGSSKPTVVLLMGGGYDDNEDTCYGSSSISCPTSPINSAPSSGNAVFVINGRTGALIKRFDTEYSVPSDLTLVDTNRDGIIDRAYFADVRGNLYRIDLPSDTSADLSLTATWDSASMTKIASLGGKVFFPPDVVVTSNFVAVLLGTGDREKPLQNTTQDHFFLIKDNVGAPRSSALSIGDLGEIAQMKDHENATIPTPEETKGQSYVNGCYLTLTTVGEKVINAPLTASGVTYFSTNRPTPANSNQCTADLGQALTYQLPLFCVVPGTPTNITGGGLAPNPVGGVVLITNADNSTQKVNFLIGAGTNNSNFSPKQPDPSVNARRSRLYWRIDNSNR
jgi:type IV pilus assembly protein PilY1